MKQFLVDHKGKLVLIILLLLSLIFKTDLVNLTSLGNSGLDSTIVKIDTSISDIKLDSVKLDTIKIDSLK